MTRIGQIVGRRYRLTQLVGGGAMGQVFRAAVVPAVVPADGKSEKNEKSDRGWQPEPSVVAVKILRAERSRERESVERFLAEVSTTRALSHPAIVRVLDAGTTDDEHGALPYVVMELLGGESLRALLRRHGRVDRTTALSVLLPVLEALAAAHAHGVVHRDVKPENIHVTRSTDGDDRDGAATRASQVKVLDFGIAKVLDASLASGHKTTAGMVVGTPGYFAPEQAVGDPRVDGRVDVFAVGAVLFELLTGRRAFEGTSPVAIAYQVVSGAVPRLADLHVEAPAAVQALLDRALAKRPDDRFTGARAFAEAIAPLVPGELGRRILLDSWLASGEQHGGASSRPTASATTVESGRAFDDATTEIATAAPRDLVVVGPTLKSKADPRMAAAVERNSVRQSVVVDPGVVETGTDEPRDRVAPADAGSGRNDE